MLTTSHQLYLVLMNELGRTPMTHWQKLSASSLTVINRKIYYELTSDIKSGDTCYFIRCGKPYIGKVIGFDLRDAGAVVYVWTSVGVFTQDTDAVRKVSAPDNGYIAVKYSRQVVRVLFRGTNMQTDYFDLSRVSEARQAYWHRLFGSEGVTVDIPALFINRQVQVVIR